MLFSASPRQQPDLDLNVNARDMMGLDLLSGWSQTALVGVRRFPGVPLPSHPQSVPGGGLNRKTLV